MGADSGKPRKSYCNRCLQETHHDLIAERVQEWVDEDEQGAVKYYERTRYEFLQCRGCENVGLRSTWTSAASPEDEVNYYPPAVRRKKPKWLSNLGWYLGNDAECQIGSLLGEIYSSLFAGNNRLALMGARAVVDVALTDKLGDIGGFEAKLSEAKKQGWITTIHFDILKAAIDAGNAASHRGYRPDTQQLELVLDIVEHLIQLLYVLKPCASEISQQTPPRPAKAGAQVKP